MPIGESRKQFKWYLDEYASSASDRETIVVAFNWGGCETLSMAANFLKRTIYVLAHNTEGDDKWNCTLYRPSTITRCNRVIETGQQIILTVQECIGRLREEKKQDHVGPIVLRFWGRHYSAFVHAPAAATTLREQHLTKEEEYDMEDADRDDTKAERSSTTPRSQGEASQDPREPETWDGSLEPLQQRLKGMTIPHDLKREIQLILQVAEPARYTELLGFLVNTVASLSLPDQACLLNTNLEDESNPRVRDLQQRFQIPLIVLKQWQLRVQEHKDEAKERVRDQLTSQSDGADTDNAGRTDDVYIPSSSGSSVVEDSVPAQRHLRRSKKK